MGKGGGGGGTTESHVTQTSLPEYVQPYFERLLQRAEGNTSLPYETYPDPRIAGFNPDTLSAQQGIRNLASYGTPAADQALGYTDFATQRAFSAGDYTPNAITGSGVFDQGAADHYMSPYIQNVIDVQKNQAILDKDRQTVQRHGDYANASAFGGSRQAVGDAIANDMLNRDLQRIQATGLQSAFDQAQQQYRSDEGSRQSALQLGMAGDELAMKGAGQLANIDYGTKQQMLLDQYRNLAAVGQDTQNLSQQGLDQAYQDFINQRDFERQNIAYMGGILHGVPVSPQSEILYNQGSGNMTSNLLGLGLGGLGLYQALNQ